MIPRPVLFLISLLFAVLAPLGAEYQQAKLVITPDGRTGSLHLYRFDSREARLQVITREGGIRNLAQAMTTQQCLAGCNGGFFDPADKPLGQVIASGKVTGNRNLASSLTSGVIYQDGDTLAIERAKTYYQRQLAPENLLQTGPFLIEKGAIVAGLSDRKFARRTLIATDGKSRWFIAYTPPITLAQLAKSLAEAGEAYGFPVETALNLDGGSSSALWVARGGEKNPFYLREVKPVANYLGICAKKKD